MAIDDRCTVKQDRRRRDSCQRVKQDKAPTLRHPKLRGREAIVDREIDAVTGDTTGRKGLDQLENQEV
jgi:hypothetical protein